MYNNSGVYYAAPYYRISNDDGDLAIHGKSESNSISNQRSLIEDYVKDKPDIILCEERIDDGFSGVNFRRPAFDKMMEDVKNGKINCIIVKDLSRFGRNYIEAGRFIQKIFPCLGVRFIAVNDHYDSAGSDAAEDHIMLPFKNLMNDSYSRDLSVKIRSQFDIRRKRGEFTGSFAAYGYCKDDQNKNHLKMDEYAAAVVRDIFDWRLAGMSNDKIASRLNSMGILSPAVYKWSQGLNYKTGFKVGGESLWTSTAIKRILENQTYTGCVVQGKRRTPSHKVKKMMETKPEEWIVVKDMHDAIISDEKFRMVQRILKMDTRTAPNQTKIYPFSGLLQCGGCGGNLVRKLVSAGKDSAGNIRKYPYYICANHKKASSVCSSHMVSEKEIEQAVLTSLRKHISNLADWKELLQLLENQAEHQPEPKINETQLLKLNEEILKNERLKRGLYEDFAEEIISKEEYFELKQYYAKQICICQKQIDTLKEEREIFRNPQWQDREWLNAFLRNQSLTESSRPFLLKLVKNVIVFEDGRIRIVFNFQYDYEVAIRIMEQCGVA